MRENNAVTLRVNGELFSWWQNVRISASLTSVVRTFSVGLTRDLALAEALPVMAGDEVEDGFAFFLLLVTSFYGETQVGTVER